MSITGYKHLYKFSNTIGIPPENLIEAFHIEKNFHEAILNEGSSEKRKAMYSAVYNAVHEIYGNNTTSIQSEVNPKDKTVRKFAKELRNKSILDVGCGEGHFLASVAKHLPHKKLVGIDVSTPHLAKCHPNIDFKLNDIINFSLDHQFDVVFSDNVIEHIAPSDLSMHLASVRSALKPDGTFILIMPNQLFGPWDVTRILDFTNTGKIRSQGTHLNESTYSKMLPILEDNGFNNFRTVCFIPKLKDIFIRYRFNPKLLTVIEHSKFMMWLLHSHCCPIVFKAAPAEGLAMLSAG